ncbi:MAG TPA: hypothetical protein VNL16_03825 [Chloroflexota bacterium]|nr:hypothetical protein [Chloroflexota bacterium]
MDPKDIQAIAEQTTVIRAPVQPLATFGITTVTYHLVTAPALTEDNARTEEAVIRTGVITANRPQLVTPSYLINLFDGFEHGEEFARYLLSSYGANAPGLLYTYKNDLQDTNVVSDPPDTVAHRLADQLNREGQVHAAVIRGVDHYWDVSLMKFIHDLTVGSLGQTIGDLGRRGLLGVDRGVPRAARAHIEELFAGVAAGEIEPLQLKTELDRWDLFDEYEDRFLGMFRRQV